MYQTQIVAVGGDASRIETLAFTQVEGQVAAVSWQSRPLAAQE